MKQRYGAPIRPHCTRLVPVFIGIHLRVLFAGMAIATSQFGYRRP